MPTMNISLTEELAKIVHNKVDSGMYNNASEVVRDAIRNINNTEQVLYELKVARLREVLAPAMKQIENGEFAEYDHDEFMKEVESNFED